MDVFDFKVAEDGDLAIINGDIDLGESTLQHQHNLLLSEKGEYKQYPTVGVGIINYLSDDADANDLQTAIQRELEADGVDISLLKINGFNNIQIEGNYGTR
jgi:hypothetical protein